MTNQTPPPPGGKKPGPRPRPPRDTPSVPASPLAALKKRFAVADARFMELLLRSGDFPSPADVTAWNAWHVERAEVAEELAAIYAALRDTEQGIGGLVWRAFETTRQHWEQEAKQHRGHIRQPKEGQ